MDETTYVSEVMGELTKYNIKLPAEEENPPHVECDAPSHEHNPRLREGNRVFAILLKQNDEWVVNDITCWQCSVRDVFERVTDDVPIAVVEGVLQETPENVDTPQICLESPEVWELTTPTA